MTDWHPYYHGAQRASIASLATLGIAAAWAWGAATRAYGWAPPWWLDTPAVFGFYGLLFWVFDWKVWRLPLLLRLHGIPDINGKYRVTVRTSHDDHTKSHLGTALIAQSWSHIVVRMDLESSSSRSKAAWLSTSPGVGFTLAYVYDNSPRSAASPSMNTHEGAATVTFSANRRATGSYYTGRGRVSFGELTLEPEA